MVENIYTYINLIFNIKNLHKLINLLASKADWILFLIINVY